VGDAAAGSLTGRCRNIHERVTGFGGIFFKCANPNELQKRYCIHPGIVPGNAGGAIFPWKEHERPDNRGYTVWGPFPDGTTYFHPTAAPFAGTIQVDPAIV
jgi:hypothetical protein